ncbi:hypothetical protein NQ317_006671 [Molorchus minor]|uniref:Uncharacterized protein n=1 Tax=Molorchus minor TaxID=1323400 RepID=A0ABQ9JVI8_9CUCU|nr:hypothetical protein NQ317_006671 [Molorchus minor]
MVCLALIMVLTVGVSASACPATCRCRNYARDSLQKNSLYYTSVSCEGFVENITSTLDNATKDLEVSHLNEMELVELLNDLTGFTYLDDLTITKSEIDKLNASAGGLEGIVTLSLIDDCLESLPDLFLNLPDLQVLDLSNNGIRVIEQESFRTLGKLEVLNLSANSLTSIDASGFSGLNVLKCLDLSRNNLTALHDRVLRPVSSLQYLNLSNNRLEVLNEACFAGLIMLQQLDVSWNRLARVAPGSLHLPSLARLLLAGNPQLGRSREAAVLVGTGRRLQTVDASRTGLKQVPTALTHSIRTLRLAGNSIRTVNCGDLDSYPLLQLLDFTSNRLEGIEEDALGRLDSLAVLYLTDNNIHEIPKSLPEKLKVLRLERNNIERVSGKDLLGLSALEVLLLGDNKIRIVDEAAFSRLVSLVALDMSRNPIAVLQPGALAGPAALQVLRLSSIQIISPAEEVSFPLSAPEHLITLDLSESPGLARQLLADTAALAASRELQELDLSRTNLESIRTDLLHYLPQLRVLHIGDNRLNCSQLEWLAAWMRRQDEPEYGDILCANPPDLRGSPLIDLQDVEISPIRAINQGERHPDNETINLHRGNDTDALQISSNFTGQYTTDSANYVSTVKSVTLPMDAGTKNVTKDDDNSFEHTNEIDKNIASAGKSETRKKGTKKQITNEVIMTGENIESESIAAIHMTTILSLNNDRISTSTIYETTTANTRPIRKDGINEVGKVAITETTASPLRRAAIARMSFEALKNANDSGKSRSNKPDHSLPTVADTSANLFIVSDGRKIINPLGATENYNTPNDFITDEHAIDFNVTEIVSTGEMSMYTNNKDDRSAFLHPGMLILAAGIMGAAAALAMLAARFTRRRRNSSTFLGHEDIEVNSLPSVTELW